MCHQSEFAYGLLIYYPYHKHKGTYGKIRIKLYLEMIGIKMNHKEIYRLMNRLGLDSRNGVIENIRNIRSMRTPLIVNLPS